MAEAELPTTWSTAGRSALGNSLWILPLVAIERLSDGHFDQAAIFGVGWLVALLVAVKLHIVQDLVSNQARRQQLRTWALIVAGAIALGFGLYRLGTQQTPPAVGQRELDDLRTQLKGERDAKSKSDQQLTNVRNELQRVQQQVEAARQAPPAPPPSLSALNQGPIIWNLQGQFLVVSGGGPDARIHNVLFWGTSTAPVSIKEAYAISELTGHRQEIMANVPYSDKGYYSVDKVDIPPEANIQLTLVWQPPLSIREFLEEWGKFRITVVYDGTTFEHRFDDNYIRRNMQQTIPGAFGPRVSPRNR